ncbi:DMT family transporter [Roseateles sp. BYS96W]|uniref:DMT family transporter n=1 Tax=Pelomonas nitida TaxID=3299027 RepID=A0ABW7GCR0_9BURK
MTGAYVRMALAMLLVGSYLVASKIILQFVPLFTAAFARQALAFVALAGWLAWKRAPVSIGGGRDRWVLLMQAFVGVFLYSVLSLYGVQWISGVAANVLMALTPAAVGLVGLLLFRERMGSAESLCLVLAVCGAVITQLGDESGQLGGSTFKIWLGAGLIVLSVFSEAVFLTFGKMLRQPLPSTVLSLVLTLLGSLMFLPFMLYEVPHWRASTVPWYVWGLMLYSGVAITALAVVLMNSAMKVVPTTSAAVFTALIPLSGVGLSVLLLGDALRFQHVLGAALVLGGMLFSVLRQQSRQGQARSMEGGGA